MNITELIAESGAQCRIYDIGRQISKVSRADFQQYELGQRAYPTPYLKHAWLAILTWQPKDTEKHNIWFLKLPLDEQNQIQPADRDAFIRHWLMVVKEPEVDRGEAPCTFRPDEYRMAYFHALAINILQQPVSPAYHTARAYMSGDIDADQWHNLGLQGIADTVARLRQDSNDSLLASALPNMHAVPRNMWLGFLEHQTATIDLGQSLCETITQALQAPLESSDLAIFARALKAHPSAEQRQQVMIQLMSHPQAEDAELVSALLSRCWLDLEGDVLARALELTARVGQDIFTALITDTMTLPGMRERILVAFRNPDRSPELSAAIGSMMSTLRRAMQSS